MLDLFEIHKVLNPTSNKRNMYFKILLAFVSKQVSVPSTIEIKKKRLRVPWAQYVPLTTLPYNHYIRQFGLMQWCSLWHSFLICCSNWLLDPLHIPIGYAQTSWDYEAPSWPTYFSACKALSLSSFILLSLASKFCLTCRTCVSSCPIRSPFSFHLASKDLREGWQHDHGLCQKLQDM